MKKTRMEHEGQPCRKCQYPVIWRTSKKAKKEGVHYKKYLFCEKCRAIYTNLNDLIYNEGPSTPDSMF